MRTSASGARAKTLIAGIDAGGTTFKCALAWNDAGHAPPRLLAEARIDTTAPDTTLDACAAFFRDAAECDNNEIGRQGRSQIGMVGVGAFGPVDIDPSSARYGEILSTPKPGWSGVKLRQELASRLSAPVRVDTDVNAALRAERAWGAAHGTQSAAYVTVGTGIGAGVFAGRAFAGAPQHPELGHIRVTRAPGDADFAGLCPFHGDCLEGLACAPALTARFGDPRAFDHDHPGWRLEAHYLAQACLTLSLSFRVQRIVLGGGLMRSEHLLTLVRTAYGELMNGYLGQSDADIAQLIVRPGLGDAAGVMGGLALALAAPGDWTPEGVGVA